MLGLHTDITDNRTYGHDGRDGM